MDLRKAKNLRWRSRSILGFLPLKVAILGLIFSSLRMLAWEQISPGDLAATQGVFDPEAEAEVLYKKQVFDQSDRGNRFESYELRVKVYRESALKHFLKYRIQYSSIQRLVALKIRVVKPNGDERLVAEEDILIETEMTPFRESSHFAVVSMPKVGVGDIVDISYRLVLDEYRYSPGFFVTFQERWPIRKLELGIRPYRPSGAKYKWISRGVEVGLKRSIDGFYRVAIENLAAYPEEPFRAPKLDTESWFMFFNVQTRLTGDAFWKQEARDLRNIMEQRAKVDTVVKKQAAELTRGMNTREEKLKALYDYSAREIVNATYGISGRFSERELKKIGLDARASEIIRSGYGSPRNIAVVFCALARAAGFDARLASVSDRNNDSFLKSIENLALALPSALVAIKNGEAWQFFDPGGKYLRMGELGWRNEGVAALIGDKSQPIFTFTKMNPSDSSKLIERGDFVLSADGTLRGAVIIDHAGNYGVELRRLAGKMEANETVKVFRKLLQKKWPGATLEKIKIINLDEIDMPLRLTFDIELPSFAREDGSRLFVQTNVFKRFSEPKLPSPTRVTDLFFEHPYQHVQSVSIALPEGYRAEDPYAPSPLEFANLMTYKPELFLNGADNQLLYECHRDLLGRSYLVEYYEPIKAAFDEVHQQDYHSVTLVKIADM